MHHQHILKCVNFLIVNAEIKGQIEYYETHGTFVTDQIDFVLSYLGINNNKLSA